MAFRIWYVMGDTEYWLEPELMLPQSGNFRVLGCKLFNTQMKYKGYWHWKNVPLELKRRIRTDVRDWLKRQAKAQKMERLQNAALRVRKTRD